LSILSIKKQEVDSLKKNIEFQIQQGRNLEDIEVDLLKKYPQKFVDFVLKDFLKKEKTDSEWLKSFRKGKEDEDRKKSYLALINYAMTSLVIGIVMRFVIWQLEKSQAMMRDTGINIGGMDMFTTLLVAFYVIFWGCVFVFVGSLGFAVYNKRHIYNINKKMFKEEQELKKKQSEEEMRKAFEKIEEQRKLAEQQEPEPEKKEEPKVEEEKPEPKPEEKKEPVKEEKKPEQKKESGLPRIMSIGNKRVIQYQDIQKAKAKVRAARNSLFIKPKSTRAR